MRERNTRIEQRAEASKRRDEISRTSDIATLELKRSALVTRIESITQEWLALSIASALIRRTRETYERDRQPAVIAQATPLFRSVTCGRYERILQREDGSGFDLLTPHGERWRESDLSQGAQEQLYLCLRIALAQEFSKDRSMLPLIMDDVLVNFDPPRAEAMARVLTEVGRTRQVLFFTCHPHTEQLFRAHNEEVRVVSLPA